MDFPTYQSKAAETDETGKELVALYGVVGEIGSILAVYKKQERENLSKETFRKLLSEEIGDTLWYLSNLATLNDLKLDEIAAANLSKAHGLFDEGEDAFFDSAYPAHEQLPRKAEFEFKFDPEKKASLLFFEGKQLGNPITDNAMEEDYYRFHDVFHLAYAAVLAWSPNLRAFLKRKRKSNPAVDENEDGARARILEESISAIVFEFAQEHNDFRVLNSIPFSLLATITRLVKKYEVSKCTRKQWQKAIFYGFKVHRELVKNKGGRVYIDMDLRRIEYLPPAG